MFEQGDTIKAIDGRVGTVVAVSNLAEVASVHFVTGEYVTLRFIDMTKIASMKDISLAIANLA